MEAHAAAHHHDANLHPPVANVSSRVDARLLGMFLFIASEVMLFGSFFTAYFFVRVVNGTHWPTPVCSRDRLKSRRSASVAPSWRDSSKARNARSSRRRTNAQRVKPRSRNRARKSAGRKRRGTTRRRPGRGP